MCPMRRAAAGYQNACSNHLDSEIFITVCCRHLTWGECMPMRANKVPAESARSGRRPQVITGDGDAAFFTGCARPSLRAARAGSVAAAVAGILGAAAFVVPAHAQTAAAGGSGSPGGSAQTSQNLQEVVTTATAQE